MPYASREGWGAQSLYIEGKMTSTALVAGADGNPHSSSTTTGRMIFDRRMSGLSIFGDATCRLQRLLKCMTPNKDTKFAAAAVRTQKTQIGCAHGMRPSVACSAVLLSVAFLHHTNGVSACGACTQKTQEEYFHQL